VKRGGTRPQGKTKKKQTSDHAKRGGNLTAGMGDYFPLRSGKNLENKKLNGKGGKKREEGVIIGES